MRRRLDSYIDHRFRSYPTVAKFIRYSAASVIGVVVGQTILLTCFVVIGFSAVTSNITAVVLGSIPNYMINRTWTFNRTGTHSVTREVIPFWSMAIFGLILSTISVAWVDRTYDGNPLLVSGANFASFGVLWVAKFMILDRILFAPLTKTPEEV